VKFGHESDLEGRIELQLSRRSPTRTGRARGRFYNEARRDLVTDNRQLCFAAMADAIHNRNDSSRMKTAPQNQLNVLRIKHVRSGKMFDVFETLDWNKTPPGPAAAKGRYRRTSAKYREAFRRLTNREIA